MSYLKIYCSTLIIFLLFDFIWLGMIAKSFYKEQIGFLMADQINWMAAIFFYLIFTAGLVLFPIQQSLSYENAKMAWLYGAIFGFVCYATYDLTNLATLKSWPIQVTLLDLIWGAFISGSTTWLVHLMFLPSDKS
jgi:uncharacterized membrane protein